MTLLLSFDSNMQKNKMPKFALSFDIPAHSSLLFDITVKAVGASDPLQASPERTSVLSSAGPA